MRPPFPRSARQGGCKWPARGASRTRRGRLTTSNPGARKLSDGSGLPRPQVNHVVARHKLRCGGGASNLTTRMVVVSCSHVPTTRASLGCGPWSITPVEQLRTRERCGRRGLPRRELWRALDRLSHERAREAAGAVSARTAFRSTCESKSRPPTNHCVVEVPVTARPCNRPFPLIDKTKYVHNNLIPFCNRLKLYGPQQLPARDVV